MMVLDSDHISELQDPHSPRGARLSQRLAGARPIPIATTIISYEEQMRGWLAAINKQPAGERQVVAYDSLAEFLAFYQGWSLLRFDQPAAKEFERLRTQWVRIGTMDLKIAAIVLQRGAKLLSANLRDFRQVPGLTVEDWLS
jgi:tRNA(fMet)-specific endonuclease VapC